MIELIYFTLRKKNPTIGGGRGSDLPEELFDQCALRWPKYVTRNVFKFEAEQSCSELDEILNFLELNGYAANWKRFPKVGYQETSRFQLKGKRIVEKEDIESAELLVVVPKNEIAESAKHLDDGKLLIDTKSLVRGVTFGRASGSFFMLCTEGIRNLLEAENFTSMIFEEVQTSSRGERIFRIGSSKEMPRLMSNLVDLEGEPYKSGSEACQINDLFSPPLLRYETEQIGAVQGCEIIFTHEHFGDGRKASWEPKTLVNQRFRLFADKHQLQIDYIPVNIEHQAIYT